MRAVNRFLAFKRKLDKRSKRFLSQKDNYNLRLQLSEVTRRLHTLTTLYQDRTLALDEGREINSLGKRKRRLEKKLRRRSTQEEL